MDNSIETNIFDNNNDKKLINLIKNQIANSKEAKFAIGYFFLSGFSLVKEDFPENIKNNKKPFLKIIMGNETTFETKEELVKGYNLREYFKMKLIEELQSKKFSDDDIKKLENLRDFISNEIIDVKVYDKTKLHSKLYLFLDNTNDKYKSPGLAVVGSSNFTNYGIQNNRELNVSITDKNDVIYLNNWFDTLWDESKDFKEDLLKVIEISGVLKGSKYPKLGKIVDPKTLFKYLVYRWFDGRVLNLLKKDILAEFQLIGVLNAVNILNYYNGVIVADSVGLGKSFIASAIIEEFLNKKHPTWLYEINGKQKQPSTLLILPPSLISQWEELLINDTSFFRRAIKKINYKDKDIDYKYIIYEISSENGTDSGKLAFISLGKFQNMSKTELKELTEEYELFVIDESHKYRNKNTNRWKNLRELKNKTDLFPNKMLLLTATPLNNSISDIYNLIGLFNDDTYAPFKIKGVDVTNLIIEYDKLRKELKKKLDENKNVDDLKKKIKESAIEIKQKILDEIMVLRTRRYIKDKFKDLKVGDKPLTFYDPKPYTLDYYDFYDKTYKEIILTIEKNIGNIRFDYTKLYGISKVVFERQSLSKDDKNNIGGVDIADLFKLLLGKRLESSIYSFEVTLSKIYRKEEIFYSELIAIANSINNEEELKTNIEKVLKEVNINPEKEIRENNVQESLFENDIDDLDNMENDSNEETKTWFDKTLEILINYGKGEIENKGKHHDDLNDFELIKIGFKSILESLRKDLQLIREIIEKLNDNKSKYNSDFKTLGKIPKSEKDIIELPIYKYENDPKIESLKQIIGLPHNKSNSLKDLSEDSPTLYRKKILIFTQYKDTAYYLHRNIEEWAKNEIDITAWLRLKSDREALKIGLVTGDTDASTKINYLKRFSPQSNKGFEEVKRFGNIEVLISTDALSEGVNLQDADAVINYDLPWNPMIIVQRVGRVNRIGNDKDIHVVNCIPSKEIEVLVGILKKLKEKISDITMIVGKETKILEADEEISVETFGEKIKNISESSMSDLEEYTSSDDFKEFISDSMSQEQLDEFKLLNYIQNELRYTKYDFEEIEDLIEQSNKTKLPYYSLIEGNDKLVGVYEFYRGKYRIMKKVMSLSLENEEVNYKTPLILKELIENKKAPYKKIENFSEKLKKMKEKTSDIEEEMRAEYQQYQKGFMLGLYNDLIVKRISVNDELKERFKVIVNALQNLPYYLYSRDLKSILTEKNLIDVKANNKVTIKNINQLIEILSDFFKDKGITDIDSLKLRIDNLGWYYEA